MILKKIPAFFWILILLSAGCKDDKPEPDHGSLQVSYVKSGSLSLNPSAATTDVPPDQNLMINFSAAVDTSVKTGIISLKKSDNSDVNFTISFQDDNKTIVVKPIPKFENFSDYTLTITSKIKGAAGEKFPGFSFVFKTAHGQMKINSVLLNDKNFSPPANLKEIDTKNSIIKVAFSEPLNPSTYQSNFSISGLSGLSYELSGDQKTVTITISNELKGYTRYTFTISSSLTAANGETFDGFSNSFVTTASNALKFPLISDDELLTLVQRQTFKFFWDYAHPSCGLTRERYGSGDIVTIGGSGFGLMALIVGVERGFITRNEFLTRMNKILGFLETCDRFHGVWPHWINGSTKKVIPFSANDNGADLVESSFLIQGLLTVREYLDSGNSTELALKNRITTLWEGVEWDWFARGGTTLYWHWSPDKAWIMNMQLRGNNETMICYILGVASPTHPIPSTSYKQGYMRNGGVVNGKTFYDIKLPIGENYGGPLFFTHYSFLGLDPRNLHDEYVNYWEQNTNHTLINRAYCIANPKNYNGYGEKSWGLTASDNQSGYSAHSPTNDLGVITPTAALSSMPYTPEESMAALKYFYYILGDKLWGSYGFYDAFNPTVGWWANSYISIDQGPIIVMIENHRTALIWDLFMKNPEITTALTKVGLSY